MPIAFITKRAVDNAKPAASTYLVRDVRLKGFVVVITRFGGKSYAVEYRDGRGRRAPKRRYTIGKHGSPWTPESARREAMRLLGLIAQGEDPSAERRKHQEGMTVADLCDLYFAEGAAHKKASTLKADRGRVTHHIKPILGRKHLDSVARADIERLMVDVANRKVVQRHAARKAGGHPKGGKGVAAQCVMLLSTLFEFAIARNLRNDNPAKGIKKYATNKVERFLSENEIRQLTTALEQEQITSGNPFAVGAIKLLMLTGCRRSEITKLEWSNVDLGRQLLRLPDSKTGSKVVYLNGPAAELLRVIPKIGDNPFVFAGARNAANFIGIDKVWFRCRKRAGLSDVRLHDLRHSFASIAVSNGISLPLIGALLGHKHAATTSRYAHLSADPIRAANELVGEKISTAMQASIIRAA